MTQGPCESEYKASAQAETSGASSGRISEQNRQATMKASLKTSHSTSQWTILGDEALDRSMTLPSFFHSGYCLPNNIEWVGDNELNIMPHVPYGVLGQTKPLIVEVKERWEWLGLDVRGPFSPTADQHTHIMTLMDYHSKWVEAFPLTAKLSQDVARFLAEVIHHQGFPVGILSRLARQTIMEINRELKKLLGLNANSLVIHHRQTGFLDLATEAILNSMLDELVNKHKDFWHIHLPATTLRLCCTNHPTTQEKPFSRMYSSEPPFSVLPRELPHSLTDIRLSSFIIVNEKANQRTESD